MSAWQAKNVGRARALRTTDQDPEVERRNIYVSWQLDSAAKLGRRRHDAWCSALADWHPFANYHHILAARLSVLAIDERASNGFTNVMERASYSMQTANIGCAADIPDPLAASLFARPIPADGLFSRSSTGLGMAAAILQERRCASRSEQRMHPIRVFLVDDHPVVVAGARALIEAADDMICIGEAHTGADAHAKIEEIAPDIVVLEVLLPDMDGVDLARQLLEKGFRGNVVIMTHCEDRCYVEQALQVGAKGYMQKRSVGQNLLLAIRTAMHGGLFLDPPTASAMLLPAEPGALDRNSAEELGLTAREEEALRLVALGHGNKEIAYRMAVSVKSVETFKMRATQKLNLRSRAEIVQFAITRGWLKG